MLILKIDANHQLLFNSHSGAIAIVNNMWYHKASKKISHWLSQNKLHLNQEEIEEYINKQKQFAYKKKNERGLFAYVSPTFKCPMGCKYCFQKSVKNCHDILNTEKIPKIIDIINHQMSVHNLDRTTVVLFGGEPLLPDSFSFNKLLIESAVNHNYDIKIVTSGATINDKYIQLLKKYSHTIHLDITIDGPKEIHDNLRPLGKNGSFDIILNNISILLKHNINVTAKTNIGQSNKNSISDLVQIYKYKKWMEKRNFKISFNFVRDYGQIDDNQERAGNNIIFDIYKLIKQNCLYHKATIDSVKELSYFAHCFLDKKTFEGGPRTSFCNPDNSTTISISPTGEIYPCNWMVGKKDFTIGTVNDGLNGQQNNYSINNQCTTCNIFSLCGGGCMIDRSNSDFYLKCYRNNIELFKSFIKNCQNIPKIDRYKIINKEFIF
jgi:uncharacterized protein